MEILGLEPGRLAEAAALVASLQRDPATHIAYESTEADAIADELEGLEPAGLRGAVVAEQGGRIVGLLALEWDMDPPRAWWHGPYVAPDVGWDEVADALAAGAAAQLPAQVTQHELAPDSRNRRVATFAGRHGFVEEEGSAVLSCRLDRVSAATPPAGVAIRPFHEDDRTTVAELHDRLFPDTHTPGHRIADGHDRWVLVAVEGTNQPIGYVAVEHQEDGSGYVDFLGVDPAAQGRGLGRALVAAGAALLRHERVVTDLHLTVRESNAVARHLYKSLGFTEERVLIPFRRGFSLS